MSSIDLPSEKDKLWQDMRADLISLVPWFKGNEMLLCPVCCRPMKYDDFSIEHIIPKQALAQDPPAVREVVSRNRRSGLTLLCRKQLVLKNNPLPGHGCNSWKGKFYDPFIKELLHPGFLNKRANSRHQIALFSLGYLGLFREYGYQIPLLPTGLLMRNQFFSPNSFIKGVPISSQMFLAGQGHKHYGEDSHNYWAEPFSITITDNIALVGLRHFAIPMPLSRDPEVPLARSLAYAPQRYTFRPDLSTAFQ